MTTTINREVEDDDHMLLLSQLYPGRYTQMIPQQGEVKVRRRRKKKEGEKRGDDSGVKKRKLSEEQVNLLEIYFVNEHKLESERKDKLALELGLDPRQVAVWFQNRRARWKSKKLEEEYCKLKSAHESIVLEKCRLESEVLRLKEQLREANKEIQSRLIERIDRILNNSPTTSTMSMEGIDPPFFGEEFGMEGNEDIDMLENNYIHGMEWVDLYM